MTGGTAVVTLVAVVTEVGIVVRLEREEAGTGTGTRTSIVTGEVASSSFTPASAPILDVDSTSGFNFCTSPCICTSGSSRGSIIPSTAGMVEVAVATCLSSDTLALVLSPLPSPTNGAGIGNGSGIDRAAKIPEPTPVPVPAPVLWAGGAGVFGAGTLGGTGSCLTVAVVVAVVVVAVASTTGVAVVIVVAAVVVAVIVVAAVVVVAVVVIVADVVVSLLSEVNGFVAGPGGGVRGGPLAAINTSTFAPEG